MRKFLLAATAVALTAAPLTALADTHSGEFKGTGISGTVTVIDAPKGVVLKIEVAGLTPGWHGIHFHEKGDCGDEKFTNAGAHVHEHGLPKVTHGLLNAEANDSGDLPNIFANTDGKATAEIYSTLVSVKGATGRPALLDADGAAVVIHANADDHTTQPIGGAGARVACAVIK
ncbi:superoxide dismutase family protein [Asticcacaulis sp. SL142]|nr:superoxide dismutase family protein [Asticcacaulis sp. SL142]WAC48029.1 superoxide dismutase family protein [Asticcacaulis sp. SL142]